MRKMKRIIVGLLALGMAFTMTACGGKEQTVTYRGEIDQSGITGTDTMTFTAKGDTVEKLTEVIEFDISAFDDDQKSLLATNYEQLVEQYNAIEGVSCTMTSGDDTITFNIDVDTTGNAIKELSEQGILTMEGGSSGKISLKASGASLESSGYEKVE